MIFTTEHTYNIYFKMGCDPEKLINLVFLRKSIYDFTDKEHSNKIIQDRLWNEISTEMKTSVAECKSKWACLRNSFARALREEKSKKSGSAASRKKKWYLFEEMSFLSSFMMQHKQTLSNLEASGSDDESEATDTEKSTENVDYNESSNEIENEGTNITSLIDRQELQVSSEPVFKKPKKTQSKNSAAEQVAGPMIEFLRSKTNKSAVEDVDLLFFKSLLPDFKKLNGKNQRQFKQFVLTTLNSIIWYK
ncbi:BESS domain-containing protein [Aphis craccivora]|uniref:BESS domain-containing protein n=1 Tax=Aphis craccivora TaxID=307492 RepID=A0A6G0W3G7_APHCR|nr:BESS domain-containing protein [Aphis craccivora]